MKKTTKIILLALILFLGAGLGAGVFLAQKQADSEVIAAAGTSDNADKPVTVLTHNAVDYPLKRRTDILLVIGTVPKTRAPTQRSRHSITMTWRTFSPSLSLITMQKLSHRSR